MICEPAMRIKRQLLCYGALMLFVAIHRYVVELLENRILDKDILRCTIWDENAAAYFARDNSHTYLVYSGQYLGIEEYLRSYFDALDQVEFESFWKTRPRYVR